MWSSKKLKKTEKSRDQEEEHRSRHYTICICCFGPFALKDAAKHYAGCEPYAKAHAIIKEYQKDVHDPTGEKGAQRLVRSVFNPWESIRSGEVFTCEDCGGNGTIWELVEHTDDCESTLRKKLLDEGTDETGDKDMDEIPAAKASDKANATPKSGTKRPCCSISSDNSRYIFSGPIANVERRTRQPTTPFSIPIHKRTNRTLCFLMTYAADLPSVDRETLEEFSLAEEIEEVDLPESVRHILIANEISPRPIAHVKDLIRLKSLEHFTHTQAYTCSLVAYESTRTTKKNRWFCSTNDSKNAKKDRHLTIDVKAIKKADLKKHWKSKAVFDQVCFDWTNMPDAYLRITIGASAIFDVLEVIKNGYLNPAGGAVFLPFSITYYKAVVINWHALKESYDIAFLYDDEVEQCHLYHGTEKLGVAKDSVGIEAFTKYAQIKGNFFTQTDLGGHEAVLREHFTRLYQPENIRMIRLTILHHVRPTRAASQLLRQKSERRAQRGDQSLVDGSLST